MCSGPVTRYIMSSKQSSSTDIAVSPRSRLVGILGTGDFARSLSKRLYYSGYDVIMGSRRPEVRQQSMPDDCLCNVRLVTTDECIDSVSTIFIAIHVENFKDLLENRSANLDGKLVIDVSNPDRPSKKMSNAEHLQELIPNALVVKAFNVISAYSLENDYNNSSRNVLIAGNDETARARVANIARDMNFFPVDLGNLTAARRIEAHSLTLFPGWRGPIGFSMAVFNICLLYLTYIYFIEKTAYQWEQIFVKIMNKAVCMTGVTTLSATYLASSFAAIFQIFYGTKHIRFPHWLDKWLKSRKQLGLFSFILIFCHVIMSLLTMSPTYYRSWYHSSIIIIKGNNTEDIVFNNINWMIWKGEAANLVGILAFVVLCCLFVSTLPSVSEILNWREWRFVQSKLGHLSLFLAVGHVLVMGVPQWMNHPRTIYKSITFLSSILPWLTLLLKLMFSLPCVDNYVVRIRKGWERNPKVFNAATTFTREGYVAMKKRENMEQAGVGACSCPGEAFHAVKIV